MRTDENIQNRIFKGEKQMDKPQIISFGEQFISNYPAEEFMASLVRAFKDGHADFIILDSNIRGQKFLAACTAWAIDRGLLYHDRNQSDGQSVVSSFRLTEAGKRAVLG